MRKIGFILGFFAGIQGVLAATVCLLLVKTDKIESGTLSCSQGANSRPTNLKPAQALATLLTEGFKIENISHDKNPNSEWSLVYTLIK